MLQMQWYWAIAYELVVTASLSQEAFVSFAINGNERDLIILILEYSCLSVSVSVSVCPSITKRPQRLTHYPTANTLSKG